MDNGEEKEKEKESWRKEENLEAKERWRKEGEEEKGRLKEEEERRKRVEMVGFYRILKPESTKMQTSGGKALA